MNLRNIFLFILVILLPGPLSLQAQSSKFTLSGTVIDAKTGETIPYVTILVKELSLWTTSDVDGNFILKDIAGGEYTLEAKCLGFEEYSVRIIIRQNISKYQLKLQAQSLALDEVTVTATDARKMNSTSNISKTALEHLQAANIQDAMQLLPDKKPPTDKCRQSYDPGHLGYEQCHLAGYLHYCRRSKNFQRRQHADGIGR